MSARVRIGELLIHAGLLTPEQLTRALEQQREQGAGGRRLGQLLVELKYVSETQLTRVLSQQLSVPWVALRHIDFSRQLLGLVPRELAGEFGLMPVYVRNERKAGDTLYLAMEDPTHDEAIRRVTAACGMPVKAMIASPSELRAALKAYDEPDRRLESTVPRARASIPPGRVASSSRVAPPPPAMPRTVTITAVEPEAVVATTAAPAPEPVAPPARAADNASALRNPRPTSAATGFALTLLDGTTIRMPSQRKPDIGAIAAEATTGVEPPTATAEAPLTTREIIRALRAVADSAAGVEIPGNPRCESLLAALLSLLIKKQVITDGEFIEEWQRT